MVNRKADLHLSIAEKMSFARASPGNSNAKMNKYVRLMAFEPPQMQIDSYILRDSMNWSRVNRAVSRMWEGERERRKFANSVRCWFMIYEFSPDIAMCFQLHWASRLPLSLSFSSCVSTLSAWCVQTQTRFAAISHTLNLFKVQDRWKQKVWSLSLCTIFLQ